MNAQEKVATLEALLARVKKNAAQPRGLRRAEDVAAARPVSLTNVKHQFDPGLPLVMPEGATRAAVKPPIPLPQDAPKPAKVDAIPSVPSDPWMDELEAIAAEQAAKATVDAKPVALPPEKMVPVAPTATVAAYPKMAPEKIVPAVAGPQKIAIVAPQIAPVVEAKIAPVVEAKIAPVVEAKIAPVVEANVEPPKADFPLDVEETGEEDTRLFSASKPLKPFVVSAAPAELKAKTPVTPPLAPTPAAEAPHRTRHTPLPRMDEGFDDEEPGADEETRLMPQPTAQELAAATKKDDSRQILVGLKVKDPEVRVGIKVKDPDKRVELKAKEADKHPPVVPTEADDPNVQDYSGELVVLEPETPTLRASQEMEVTGAPTVRAPDKPAARAETPARASASPPLPVPESAPEALSEAQLEPVATKVAESESPVTPVTEPAVVSTDKPLDDKPLESEDTPPEEESSAPPRRYAGLPPPRRASPIMLAMVALVLGAAGIYVSLRNGWIGSSPQTVASSTATALPTAPPRTTAVTPVMTTTASATAAPTAPATVDATTAPSAAATAVPSASVSAGSTAPQPSDEADGSQLPATRGYLVVESSSSQGVYATGRYIGLTGQKLTVDCGAKYLRLAAPPGEGAPLPVGQIAWTSSGKSVVVACKTTTKVTIETK